jgi:hypothetical protein
MWKAYVRFCDWWMAKENPEDPFSHRAISAEEFAEMTVILSVISIVLYCWFDVTYCH